MNIVEFLNSKNDYGYGLSTDIESLGDYIYEEEFNELLEKSNKKMFSFNLQNKEDLEDKDFSTILTMLPLKKYNKNEIVIEVEYKDSSDEEYINDIYNKANLTNVSLYVYPAKDVNKEDYTKYLSVLTEKLLDKNNKIYIYPVVNFYEYFQQKLMIENMVEHTEENKEIIESILLPEKKEGIKEVLLRNISEEEINKIKMNFFNSIDDEEREKILEEINLVINIVKKEIEEKKELYGLDSYTEYE